MIRKYSISFKLYQLNKYSDQELLEQAAADSGLSSYRCPFCGNRKHFRRINPYERQMITVKNSKRVVVPVFIPRVQCTVCSSSHSCLPDNLIPFSSYTLRFILTVLSEYLSRSDTTVNLLCDKWQIAVSTLYTWIRLFSEHFSLWKKSADTVIPLSKETLRQVYDTERFPALFFEITGFSFLQCSCKNPRPHSGPAPL